MALLKDQVCIVTGAGQGLGRTVALEMAAEGAAVALLERNPETVKAVAAEIGRKGGRAESYELDVTNYDANGAAVADVLRKFGRSMCSSTMLP
jgi:NAD(P)-dependent dehydrogenase (short-subunit alcohol dehydrogenase family)